MKYLLIVLLMGCAMEVEPPADYEDARYATIVAWEEVIGRVSTECYEYTGEFLVVEVDHIEKKDQRSVIGRTYIEDQQIHILKERSNTRKLDTAVHEFIHVLAQCEFGDPDKEHMHHRLWIGYGIATVEAWGCAEL